jgi:ribosome-binding protein aMBF1 (putative translation factor)
MRSVEAYRLWTPPHGTYFRSSDMAEPLSDATRELGRRIRARREALGKSQERLADSCGLHWTFVGQVERGRRNLSFHNLLRLAAALEVDPAELVSGLAPPPRPAP